ncbi:hypothetical protein VNO78_15847 [Psophocarpus tetragonolobus]|uniref:Uncharacterized protein n=1 Tax=Psophocarpus tetragonolobus TaxID=3891 RepID=A0AAN9SFA8_PSOTE
MLMRCNLVLLLASLINSTRRELKIDTKTIRKEQIRCTDSTKRHEMLTIRHRFCSFFEMFCRESWKTEDFHISPSSQSYKTAGMSDIKDAFAVAFRNLLDVEGSFDSCMEVTEPLSKGVNSITDESKDEAQSPLRKALSPINTNANQETLEALSFTQTPFLETCSTNKGIQKNGTPLSKFSTRSSTLKGVGEKMAEYIIDLREESPLKSVSIKNIYKTDTELNQHNALGDSFGFGNL